jgi:hypothetical protein
MKRGGALRKRYSRAHGAFPRIRVIISRDVSELRSIGGDAVNPPEGSKFAIEARMQDERGGPWRLVGLRFSPLFDEARAISREIGDSVTAEYRPAVPVEVTHGTRNFEIG